MAGEWETKRIGDLGRVVTGKTPSTAVAENFGGTYPFITIPDMDGRREITISARTLSEQGAQSLRTCRLPAGAVMMSCIATIGNCGITTRPSFTNQQINSLICGDDTDPKFVYYCFTQLGHALEAAGGGGSVYTNVSKSRFEEIELTLPLLAEQKAIASVLGALDDKIELNRRMNATLEAMARALFQSWFVDFDPVRAKLDGRKPEGMNTETAAHFPSSFQESAVGKIPKGWKVSCLGQHVSMQRGTTYKSKLKDLPGPYLLGLGSIARNGGFKDNKLRTYGGDSPEKLIVRPGDIFASLKDVTQSADLLGAVARVPSYIVEGRLTQDTVKLIFDGEPISQNFAYEVLMAPDYRAYCRNHATGTTNLGLSRDDFFSYPVVLPSTDIQNLFEEFSNSVNQQINRNNDQSRTLATLRDTLLPKLLSGELSAAILDEGGENL